MRPYIQIITACFTWSIFFFCTNTVVAQYGKKDTNDAIEQATILKTEGALIFCLQSRIRKLNAIDQQINSSGGARRKELEGKRLKTITRRDKLNSIVAQALKDTFSFCKVYMMYDTAITSFKNGVRSGIFLDKTGNVDKDISFEEQHAVFLFYKDKSGTYPTDGLLLEVPGKKMRKPFPVYKTIRSSWLNDINRKGINRGLYSMSKRLKRLSEKP